MEQFEPLFDWAQASGEKIVRLHLTVGLGAKQLAAWDRVLDSAAAHGLFVLPVFSNWADWKNNSLLASGETRRQWLEWTASVVRRWKDRPEIFGWEIFSEVDLVPGASESLAEDFVAAAVPVVRASDPLKRPVTASLAAPQAWAPFYRPLDFVESHVYADDPAFHGDLDRMILARVRQLSAYGKPVLLGECGLDSRVPKGTLDAQPASGTGIRHAIWASIVSGAMNGRMLWWQDGYDQYSKVDLRTAYRHAAEPAVRFVAGVDFAGLRPLALSGKGLEGAALGRPDFVLGWVRDAQCAAPSWLLKRIAGRSVSLDTAGRWRVTFYETVSGRQMARGTAAGGHQVTVALPPFSGSVAFQMRRLSAR